MKILLTGVTGFRNRGVEALVVPTIRELLAQFPEAHIQVATWTPDYDKSRLTEFQNVETVIDPFLNRQGWGSRLKVSRNHARLKKLARKFRLTSKSESLPPRELLPYEVPDLVVLSGGDLVSSDYGTECLTHFLEPIHWAAAHGIRSALIGQSIGIFKNSSHVALWECARRKASLITVREPLSKRYLVDELGDRPETILETSDCAFLLHKDEGLAHIHTSLKNSPVVGLSISESICRWSEANYDAHIDAWAEISKRIIKEWGARIVMIPHVQDQGSDDRVAATKVWRKLGFDSNITLAAADLSASEFKGILSTCDMVIAERMHAAIGALSTGVVTVPIGYSIKAEGIITQIYRDTSIDPLKAVIPVGDFLNTRSSWPMLDDMWNSRETNAQSIQSRLPGLIQSSKRNFELIRDLF